MAIFTPEELQSLGFGQSTPDEDVPELTTMKSRTDVKTLDNLMLGFLTDDAERAKYLREKYPTSKIDIRPDDGGVYIDDARVNPEGFDWGDLPRSAGEILPFVGQIIGGVAGAGGGAALSAGTASVPGMIAGGALGAGAGETARLAIGKFFGYNNDEMAMLKEIASDTALGGVGEVAGLGIGAAAKGAGKIIGQTKAYKTLGSMLKKAWKPITKLGPQAEQSAIKYVMNVPEPAQRAIKKVGIETIADDAYFANPNLLDDMARKVFMGEGSSKVDITRAPIFDIDPAMESVVAKIAKDSSDVMDKLARDYYGFDDSMLSVIKNNRSLAQNKMLFNPERVNPEAIGRLSNAAVDMFSKTKSQLSKNIAEARAATIAQRGNASIKGLSGQGQRLEGMLKQSGLFGDVISAQGKTLSKGEIHGAKELRNILNEFMTKDGMVDEISLGNLNKLWKRVDAHADALFNNPKADGQLKMVAKQFLNGSDQPGDLGLRQYLNDVFGTSSHSKAYGNFMKLMDDMVIDISNNSTQRKVAFENAMKSFDGMAVAEKDAIKAAVKGMRAESFLDEMQRVRFVDKLRGQKAETGIAKLAQNLDNPGILDDAENLTRENTLRQISDKLQESKSYMGVKPGKSLVDDAEIYQAAKALRNSKTDALRLLALSSVAGGLGFASSGPVGGLAAAGVAVSLNTPKGKVEALKALQKLGMKAATAKKAVSDIASKTQSPGAQRALSALITLKAKKDEVGQRQ